MSTGVESARRDDHAQYMHREPPASPLLTSPRDNGLTVASPQAATIGESTGRSGSLGAENQPCAWTLGPPCILSIADLWSVGQREVAWIIGPGFVSDPVFCPIPHVGVTRWNIGTRYRPAG